MKKADDLAVAQNARVARHEFSVYLDLVLAVIDEIFVVDVEPFVLDRADLVPLAVKDEGAVHEPVDELVLYPEKQPSVLVVEKLLAAETEDLALDREDLVALGVGDVGRAAQRNYLVLDVRNRDEFTIS